MTRDGSTRKDNPFAKRSKPLDIGKRPSRRKNRIRAEIDEGLEQWQDERTLDMEMSEEATPSIWQTITTTQVDGNET